MPVLVGVVAPALAFNHTIPHYYWVNHAILCVLSLLCLLTPIAAAAPPSDPLENAERIVFLGDSITNDGHYINLLEAALRKSHPNAEFINLGLPSEGCTGLSEPAHPFPRPDVHERLLRHE